MSIIAGIDVGTETVEIVMLNDEKMVYSSTMFAGTEAMANIAEKIFSQGVRETGISADAITLIGGTGVNASEVPFIEEEVPEAICCSLGMNWLYPQAHTLIDVGASKFVVMKCQQGRTVKIARSDRCASSVGVSLRMVANVLAMNIEDIGQASMRSREEVAIQSTCSVFVETEIISLLHHYKKKREDILKGVFRGMASRFYSLLLTIGIEDDMYMIGGVAKNEGVVKALENISGHQVLVPPDPNIVGALGAALAVSNRGVAL